MGDTDRKTVLVVEDEALIRDLAMAVLGDRYRVLAAENAADAAALFSQERGAVDLLLTDLSLPGMSGKALADLLRARRPRLGVIYTSGLTIESQGADLRLDDATTFLLKPFELDALVAMVDGLMGRLRS